MRLPLVWMMLAAVCAQAAEDRFIEAVRVFADQALEYGRDTYGPKRTPLFVDGVHIDTHAPTKWKSTDGTEWVLSNLGNQQIFMRTLVGLTGLTGDKRYKQAAVDATRYALSNLVEDGFLVWGGHMAYDASNDKSVFAEDKAKVHELKNHFPYYELMWQIDPDATKQLIESMWRGHILDWGSLDFNRHGVKPRNAGSLWDSEYEGGPVFFWGKGLTFINAGSDLYYAAAMLSKLEGHPDPLVWAKRLAHRYVETRNPKTGIGGYQFSQMASAWCDDVGKIRGDRAVYQYGEDFKGHHVVEGTLFPTYGSTPEVRPRLCQMYLAEALGDRGKEFLQWSVEEMTAWGKAAYREKDNSFVPMLTDGTSMEGYVIKKDGYFGPKGRVLKAGKAGAIDFWTYAMGYRMSGDEFLGKMVRSIMAANEFEKSSDPYALFGYLELYKKTKDAAMFKAAERIGDHILKTRIRKGWFSPGAQGGMARLDRLEPLALLHVAAAMRGRPYLVPAYTGGGGFYAAAYDKQGHKYDEFLYR